MAWTSSIGTAATASSWPSTASLSASENGKRVSLTTRGAFNVNAATGGHSMVYTFNVAGGAFSGPIFSAPAHGLTAFVDALQVEE